MRMRFFSLFVFSLVVLVLASCSTRREGTLVERMRSGYYPYRVMKRVSPGYTQYGIASWYGGKFQGRRTASGEIYNMFAHTAAHKTLPFGTYVRVTNLNNHRETVVRINDRGPFIGKRVIDLSYAAAKDLGMIGPGTAPVKIVVVKAPGYDYGFDVSEDGIKDAPIEKATRFTIQVGSFSRLINALRFRDRLSRSLNDVRIVRVNVHGEVLYRVLVGSFDSKSAALSFAYKNVVPIVGTFCVKAQ